MLASARPVTANEVWIPRPGGAGAWRSACILFAAAIGLAPGIAVLVAGHVLAGSALIGLDLIVLLFLLGRPAPAGVLVTADTAILERRSLLRRDRAELPRSVLSEVWMEEAGQDKLRLYLYAVAPDGEAHAIPLTWGTREEVQPSASAVAELLRLPLPAAFLPPTAIPREQSFTAAVAAGVAEHNARQKRLDDAAVRAITDGSAETDDLATATRTINKHMTILRSFGAIPSPETWLVSTERRILTHQNRTGRTQHRFDEIVAVEVEPEKLAEEHGTDSDTTYLYCYGVFVIVASGERGLICRCASSEPQKTEESEAHRDAQYIAGSLRRTFKMC